MKNFQAFLLILALLTISSASAFANGDPGPGEFALVEYDSDGNQESATTYELNSCELEDWAMAPNGDVYLVSANYLFGMAYLFPVDSTPMRFAPGATVAPVQVETDPDGNAFFAGFISNVPKLGKYSPTGTELWVADLPNAANSERIVELMVDNQGDAFVLYESSAEEGPYTLAKVGGDGSVLWSEVIIFAMDWTNRYLGFPNMALDDAGKVYIVTEQGNEQQHKAEVLLAVYASDGELVWEKHSLIDPGEGCKYYATGIEVSADGDIGVKSVECYTEEYRSLNFSIRKYDSAGNRLWKQTCSTPGADGDLAVGFEFDSAGNVLVAGTTSIFDVQYYGQMFTAKFDPDGSLLWSKHLIPAELSKLGSRDMVLDASGNLIVVGGDSTRYVLVKYSTDGQRLWTAQYQHADTFYMNYPDYVWMSSGGNIMVAGSAMTWYKADADDDDVAADDDDSWSDDDDQVCELSTVDDEVIEDDDDTADDDTEDDDCDDDDLNDDDLDDDDAVSGDDDVDDDDTVSAGGDDDDDNDNGCG